MARRAQAFFGFLPSVGFGFWFLGLSVLEGGQQRRGDVVRGPGRLRSVVDGGWCGVDVGTRSSCTRVHGAVGRAFLFFV